MDREISSTAPAIAAADADASRNLYTKKNNMFQYIIKLCIYKPEPLII
jgi:hypothetical protein